MNSEEALKVSQGLTWMSERLCELPEDRKDAVQAGLICTMANLIVTVYAQHLHDGLEPYDALLKASRGDLELSPEMQTVFQVLMAKPKE